MRPIIVFLITSLISLGCHSKKNEINEKIILGAERTGEYTSLLTNKKVGVLVNHTSVIGEKHLVDTLISLGINIQTIFSPEHGFRGDRGAGEQIDNTVDPQTNIPIVSLYGKNKKPASSDMQNLDWVIFDIQDVGTRFYTYISSMHYMMEACSENEVKMMVLDRPNPNGMYIEGPVLDTAFQSFVGMHPIPILHGLTVAELAKMINGEGWLKDQLHCELEIIEMENYQHHMDYSLQVKPSPNLPNDLAIKLYPSLCMFEGTTLSIGRGTDFPFQVVGYPDPEMGDFQFTPQDMPGMAMNPKHENEICYGVDFRDKEVSGGFNVAYLIDFYQKMDQTNQFFNNYFNTLAGNDDLQRQIKEGLTQTAIEESWERDLEAYKLVRSKYLIYED